MDKYEVTKIKRDGKEIIKFKCPKCSEWGDIDNDQYNGKVSIFHEKCSFHETINLKKEIKEQ